MIDYNVYKDEHIANIHDMQIHICMYNGVLTYVRPDGVFKVYVLLISFAFFVFFSLLVS